MEKEEPLLEVKRGNWAFREALFLLRRPISREVFTLLLSDSEFISKEVAYRELRLLKEKSRELDTVAKIFSFNRIRFCRCISNLHSETVTKELELYCRIAVSLSSDNDPEDVWNALFTIWQTAYPTEMAQLGEEQISLLHERSLHKLESLAGAKPIDLSERMRAVYKEIGTPKELIDAVLGPDEYGLN